MIQAGQSDSGDAVKPITVMIVDDSIVIRSIIEKTLKADARIKVVGHASNGEEAVRMVGTYSPDIIILDIEMPIMDGITALPLLLKNKPGVKILMCSTLSERGADISVRALALGATECLLKPSGPEAIRQSDDFHAALIRIVLSLGHTEKAAAKAGHKNIALRKITGTIPHPQILTIGSSTGGPNALIALLTMLRNLSVPIVITQHMPKTFTAILANHIEKATGITCQEGKEGMVIQAGNAYVAPGGYHMLLKKQGVQTTIALSETPPENFCKPSVDPMLRSAVEIYGSRILTVILTGMGSDGLHGCEQVVNAGGHVIAQDEATSVVWGMPGAVATAGLCNAVLPIPQLGDWVLRTIKTQGARAGL
ncbi:MAG TPA: chemotaxis response regulator protein-glutamate methylesterase [Micavibrio sp.]|jgi:two-component system chemotaxis response regulator CheB